MIAPIELVSYRHSYGDFWRLLWDPLGQTVDLQRRRHLHVDGYGYQHGAPWIRVKQVAATPSAIGIVYLVNVGSGEGRVVNPTGSLAELADLVERHLAEERSGFQVFDLRSRAKVDDQFVPVRDEPATPPPSVYRTTAAYLSALEAYGATVDDLPLLIRKLGDGERLARRVQVTNKHGSMETGRRGDCAPDCTKCLADTFQKIEEP